MIRKICVLMASYNGAEYIEEQIKSILSQHGVDVTLYISDDLSTDNTLSIIHKFQSHNNVHLLSNQNKFGSAGKNFFSLIERVNFKEFEFVAFADQDDIWNSDKLFKSVLYLEHAEGCAGVSSCVEAFWPEGRLFYVNKAMPQKDFDYFFEAAGPGCTYLFKSFLAAELKSLLRSQPWIQTSVFCHDWLVYSFARKKGYGWYVLPFSTMKYRQHDKNEMGVNTGLLAFKMRLKKLKSGWALDQVYAVAKAVGYENDLKAFFPVRAKANLNFYLNFRKMRRKMSDALILVVIFLFKIQR
jgi:rhamnosyltransferase